MTNPKNGDHHNRTSLPCPSMGVPPSPLGVLLTVVCHGVNVKVIYVKQPIKAYIYILGLMKGIF